MGQQRDPLELQMTARSNRAEVRNPIAGDEEVAAIMRDLAVEHPAAYVLKHPGAFALQTLKGFRANQGLLLAGAVWLWHRWRSRAAVPQKVFLSGPLWPSVFLCVPLCSKPAFLVRALTA